MFLVIFIPHAFTDKRFQELFNDYSSFKNVQTISSYISSSGIGNFQSEVCFKNMPMLLCANPVNSC